MITGNARTVKTKNGKILNSPEFIRMHPESEKPKLSEQSSADRSQTDGSTPKAADIKKRVFQRYYPAKSEEVEFQTKIIDLTLDECKKSTQSLWSSEVDERIIEARREATLKLLDEFWDCIVALDDEKTTANFLALLDKKRREVGLK